MIVYVLELGSLEFATHTILMENWVLYLTTELDCFLAINIWILAVNTISKNSSSTFMKRETFGPRNIFSQLKYYLVIIKCWVLLWRWKTRYCSIISSFYIKIFFVECCRLRIIATVIQPTVIQDVYRPSQQIMWDAPCSGFIMIVWQSVPVGNNFWKLKSETFKSCQVKCKIFCL